MRLMRIINLVLDLLAFEKFLYFFGFCHRKHAYILLINLYSLHYYKEKLIKSLIYFIDSSGELDDFTQDEDPVQDFKFGMLKAYILYC